MKSARRQIFLATRKHRNSNSSCRPLQIENGQPYILVLGMGGTISGISANADKPLQYQAGQVSVDTLLQTAGFAAAGELKVLSRQVANIDSQNLTHAHLTELGECVSRALDDPWLQGLVITHGTDTMEETAIFLHLTCGHKARRAGKRVVLTGAMLPSNARQSDGPQNLSDAVTWASATVDGCPGGVYGVFAGKVCLGWDLSKRHATDLDAPLQAAFCSAVDALDPAWLSVVKSPHLPLANDLPIPPSDAWPWVEILTSHAGARAESMQQLLGSGVQGLVVAGTGLGGFHSAWAAGLQSAARQGIAVVRSSRAGAGVVSQDIPDKELKGMVAAGNLSAPKARIALQLALYAVTRSSDSAGLSVWQDVFVNSRCATSTFPHVPFSWRTREHDSVLPSG
jgi:L-asparaginase